MQALRFRLEYQPKQVGSDGATTPNQFQFRSFWWSDLESHYVWRSNNHIRWDTSGDCFAAELGGAAGESVKDDRWVAPAQETELSGLRIFVQINAFLAKIVAF